MATTHPDAQATSEQDPTTLPGPSPKPAEKKEGLIKRVVNKIRSILGRKKATEPAFRPQEPVIIDNNHNTDNPQAVMPQQDGGAHGPPVLPAVNH